MRSDLFGFCIPTVEDKVKDQLEAANPEPVIEEVVSWIPPTKDKCYCRAIMLFHRTPFLAVNAAPGLSVSWLSVFHFFYLH